MVSLFRPRIRVMLAWVLFALVATASAYDSIPAPKHVLGFGRKLEILASGENDRLLIHGGDDSVRLHELKTGKVLKTISGNPLQFLSMRYSAKSNRFAVGYGMAYPDYLGGGVTGLKLFDGQRGDSLALFIELAGMATGFDFTPDGKKILLSYNDGRLVLLDSELKATDSTKFASSPVYPYYGGLSFSGDGSRALLHTHDSTASLINLSNLAVLKKYDAKVWNNCNVFELSPDGSAILAYNLNASYKYAYINAITGNVIHDVSQFRAQDWRSVGFSSDGKKAFTSVDSGFKVWDLQTGMVSATLTRATPYAGHRSIAFSPDGNSLVGQTASRISIWDIGTQRRWDRASDDILGRPFKDAGGIEKVIINGLKANGYGADDSVHILRISDGNPESFRFPGYYEIRSAAFSSNGSRIHIQGLPNDQVWDLEPWGKTSEADIGGNLMPESRAYLMYNGNDPYFISDLDMGVRKIARNKYGRNGFTRYSVDLNYAVYFDGITNDSLRVEEIATEKVLCALPAHMNTLDELKDPAISYHGDYFFVHSFTKGTQVVDTRSCRVIASINEVKPRRYFFSPTGGYLALNYSQFNSSCVTSITDTLSRHTEFCFDTGTHQYGVAFSDDGSKVAVGNRIYDTKTGKLALKINLDEKKIGSENFSPDGLKLLVVSQGGPLSVWDLSSHVSRIGIPASSTPGRPFVTLSAVGPRRIRWTSHMPGLIGPSSRIEIHDTYGRRVALIPLEAVVWKAGNGEAELPANLAMGCYTYRFMGMGKDISGSKGRIFLP